MRSGRELDVLAAVVLGGARLGGGRRHRPRLHPRRFACLGDAEWTQPDRGVALRFQDDRRRHHPRGDYAVECALERLLPFLKSRRAQRCAAWSNGCNTGSAPKMSACSRPGGDDPVRLAAPNFLSPRTFGSVAFQLPELGLLTLAMLMPIMTGGINLAVTFTANLSGLTLAWVLQAMAGSTPASGPSCWDRCWRSASGRGPA